MQEIFILRHGQAEELDKLGKNSEKALDFDRKLTEEGKEKTKKLSLFFNALNEEVDLVLSSPYIRAKETAEIFISCLIPKPSLKIVDFLRAGSSSKEIASGLINYPSSKKIVLVGHAPDLEIFLGKLISASKVKLKKGAIGKIILDNSIELSGELVWLLTPGIVKKFKLKKSIESALL